MSTTSEIELRAEISWLEARNREVNRQRIEAETLARSQAVRLAEMEQDNARLRSALEPFAAQRLASSLTEEKIIRAARAALNGEAT
jgi:hypothetical protein